MVSVCGREEDGVRENDVSETVREREPKSEKSAKRKVARREERKRLQKYRSNLRHYRNENGRPYCRTETPLATTCTRCEMVNCPRCLRFMLRDEIMRKETYTDCQLAKAWSGEAN